MAVRSRKIVEAQGWYVVPFKLCNWYLFILFHPNFNVFIPFCSCVLLSILFYPATCIMCMWMCRFWCLFRTKSHHQGSSGNCGSALNVKRSTRKTIGHISFLQGSRHCLILRRRSPCHTWWMWSSATLSHQFMPIWSTDRKFGICMYLRFLGGCTTQWYSRGNYGGYNYQLARDQCFWPQEVCTPSFLYPQTQKCA